MRTVEEQMRNAEFWLQCYRINAEYALAYGILGNAERAAAHRSIAEEMLDWHFSIVDQIAEMEEAIQ